MYSYIDQLQVLLSQNGTILQLLFIVALVLTIQKNKENSQYV